jgi:hypothetical protein
MKAEEFDRKFDQGEDVTNLLDLSEASSWASAEKSKRRFSPLDD